MANGREPGRDREQPSVTSKSRAIERPGMSSMAKVLITAATALLVVWFFIAWLALNRHVLDAAGESVGSAFVLLIIASVVGAIRGSR
jgi:hypothetical protein